VTVPDTAAAEPPLVIRQQLASQYPEWDITTETDELSRTLYVATARQLGTHPHMFSTTDPGRMRAVLGAGQ